MRTSLLALTSALSWQLLAAATQVHAHDCPPPPPPATEPCLFGEVFRDIRENPALTLTQQIWIRDVAGLTPLESEQLVRAVQQSSHDDVVTPAEALARVDQAEIRRIDFLEIASGRAFVVLEYGAGDNSYGAFFELSSAEVVASIHDGDLLDCSVYATP